MKKTLSIATLMLGLSAVAGTVYAASNTDMWETTKSSEPVSLVEMAKEKGITVDELIVQLGKEGKLTKGTSVSESAEAEGTMSGNVSEVMKSSEPVNLEEMAKEKGITVKGLIAQLEKEGKLTKATSVTASVEAEGNIESTPINLEEMAKQKGITLEELIAQLEKEGKLTKAAKVTEAVQVETSNK
ncbi:hypothetical protein ACIP9C_13725 [Lysinibacillus sp. NPDC093210]|uniref:hypothetical protein n=1 Tax=Lysinibacillus sp. NPDC093210 TaxID=3364133 RepID=UPI00382191D9